MPITPDRSRIENVSQDDENKNQILQLRMEAGNMKETNDKSHDDG